MRESQLISVSPDGGNSWNYPVVLSEQSFVSNGDGNYLTALPNIAVNNEGVVAVSWYDRRGLPPSRKVAGNRQVTESVGWNIRARISIDGGSTWLPSVQLNSEQSGGLLNVGHTAGLAASADGRFHSLWIDGRSRSRQLWTTTFGIE